MNSVNLIGRLVRNPELRYTNSNHAVANFTLAVNRSFTNAQGEREADFVSCIACGKQAENLVKFIRKGGQIAVIGRIQTGSFEDNDGKRHYTTDIVAENIEYLESKNKNGEQQTEQIPHQPQNNAFAPTVDNFLNSPDFSSTINVVDEDLPF